MMPLYEYVCSACSVKFEELRKSSEMDDEIECPKCGGKKTNRVLSAFVSAPGGEGGLVQTPPCSAGSGSCSGCCKQ